MNTDKFEYSSERFADLQMLRYKVPGFELMDLDRKKLVYCLAKAAMQGRDILFDQNGRYNLRIRKLLEDVYLNFDGDRESDDFIALEVYLKRVWFSNGIHHHYSTDKFLPDFSEDFLRGQIKKLGIEGCEELLPVMFNPDVMPKRVSQAEGADLIESSAANYYRDVTQEEAEAFYAAQKAAADDSSRPVMYGMNSRLEKRDGRLVENVWKEGGLYGEAIEKIIFWLEKAREFAPGGLGLVIEKLVEFYRTGDLHVFDEYSVEWLEETDSEVDFLNCFIETYGDPLGLKASWEAYVNFTDREATHRTETLSRNAQWFEDNSPVDARFKKEKVRGVSARVVTAAILGGDLYPSSAIGINLPNSNWIRSEHGSKSVTIGNLTDAYNKAAAGNGFRQEFVYSDKEIELLDKYADMTDDLHTDLHECLGHGSGKLLPGVDPDALKAYGATVEEARADLFGLYYMADEKLVELGLLPDMEAYKAAYYSYMMNGLMTQMARIKPGMDVEEAHMRDRQLIARWVFEHGREENVAQLVERDGKTYLRINDYEKMRTLFGNLLAEIQRVKSEGDFEEARRLVETYGVKVDRQLHEEVRRRYFSLGIAPYKGFINPRYELVREGGQVRDVKIDYSEGYAEQMLRYSREYNNLSLNN